MFRFAIVIAVLGAGIGYAGYQDWQLSQVIKPTPQTISCDTLATQGPGDNHHISLTDFVLSDHGVYWENNLGQVTTAWFPTVPLGSEEHVAIEQAIESKTVATGIEFNVIVEMNNISSLADIDIISDQEFITGYLVNEVRTMKPDIQKLIRESYPGIDLNSCWILSIGKPVPTTSLATAKLGGGAGLILIAGILGFAGFRNINGQQKPVPDSITQHSQFASQAHNALGDSVDDGMPTMGQASAPASQGDASPTDEQLRKSA